MSDPQFRDLIGKQGFPQDCFETCGKPSCFLDGCEKPKRARAEAAMSAVERLQAEYAELHRDVLRLCRDEMRNRPQLDRLQQREEEIVAALKKLGAEPYPDVHAEARAH